MLTRSQAFAYLGAPVLFEFGFYFSSLQFTPAYFSSYETTEMFCLRIECDFQSDIA